MSEPKEIKQAQNITPLAPQLVARNVPQDAPHSEHLEQSVLAAVLHHPQLIHKLKASVGNCDVFYMARHKLLYEAMSKVAANGYAVDIVTVCEQLEVDNATHDSGGMVYLNTIYYDYQRKKNATSADEFDGYIKQLKGFYARWQLIRAADRMRNQAYDLQSEPDKVLVSAQSFLGEVSRFVLTNIFKPTGEKLQEHAEYTDLAGKQQMVYSTGITALDSFVGGLQRQKVCVIAGRKHHAKTSVGISTCLNMARLGLRVMVFNVADGNERDVLSRFIAMEGNLSYANVVTGNLSQSEYGRYIEAMSKIRNMNIIIRSKKGMTISALRSEAQSIASNDGIDVIFIDYIQRLQVDTDSPEAPRDNWTRQAFVSQQITEIAEELDVPVVVAAQINRDGDGKMPSAKHIKGCGNIEEDADLVLLVWREYLDSDSIPPNLQYQIQIKVAANKQNGVLGTAITNINSQSTYITG